MITKAMAIIFLLLGWINFLNSPILRKIEKDKDAKRSILFLAIGTILTFFTLIP